MTPILIAHRGNTNGPNPELENTPAYIQKALDNGFFVEVDIYYKNNNFYMGHYSNTTVLLPLEYFKNPYIFLHCKDVITLQKAIQYLKVQCLTDSSLVYQCDIFYHEFDNATITLTTGLIWAFPFKGGCSHNTIFVCPEFYGKLSEQDFNTCFGVCSDYVGINGGLNSHIIHNYDK